MVAAMVGLLFSSAQAASVSQHLILKPGWNAVFLQVEPNTVDVNGKPTTPTPELVFAGLTGVQSAWAWNPRSSAVEYIQNPNQFVAKGPYMLSWFPGQPLITNLRAIHGEQAYLINIAAGTPPQTWTVEGEPTVPRIDWKPNSFNLVGFHLELEADNETFYSDFFASAGALAGQDTYRLDNATGEWRKAISGDRMAEGEAFWIYCNGSSTFGGPVSVQMPPGNLDYGKVLTEQELSVRNDSGVTKSILLEMESPAPPKIAAQVYLWEAAEMTDPKTLEVKWTWSWKPLTTKTIEVRAGAAQKLRVGVLRSDLLADDIAEANLLFKDAPSGMAIRLPLSVAGVGMAGLWVGDAVVTEVSRPETGSATTEAVGSPFMMRLIVHRDIDGNAKLLREVVQLWQRGNMIPDPDGLGHLVVDKDNPGSYVLVANMARVAEYSGTALRDGVEVGRRISSTAFGFTGTKAATSGSFVRGGTLTFDVNTLPDDITNPFAHQYNKQVTKSAPYKIERTIRLTMVDSVAEDGNSRVPILNWGSTEVDGVYEETMTLGPAYTVHVKGIFNLKKVSDVATVEE
jgi:hypothetical protein